VRVLEPTPDNMNSINEKVSHDLSGLMLSIVLALTTLEMQHEDLATLNSRVDRLNRCDGEGIDQ